MLLDVHLPDASGFDIISRLGGRAVVLISTRGGQEYAELIGSSGARSFVPKDQLCRATLEPLLGEA